MGTSLDIAGSFILAGMMILSFGTFIVDKQNAEISTLNKVVNQVGSSSNTSLLMHDLRKAGYGSSNQTFRSASESGVTFIADLDNNGSVDTVRYWFGGPEYLSAVAKGETPLLYRKVNNEQVHGSDLDILSLRFTYYTNTGTQTTNLADIRAIDAFVSFKDKIKAENGTNATNYTNFRIVPKNAK